MGAHARDARALGSLAEAYFAGLDAEAMTNRLGIARETAAEQIEALEAVLLLAAHGLPEELLARATRLSGEVAGTLLGAIRTHLGDQEAIRTYIADHPAVLTSSPASSPAKGEPRHQDVAPSEDAEQALAVLDFWASKWL